jgi:hypothetical protein
VRAGSHVSVPGHPAVIGLRLVFEGNPDARARQAVEKIRTVPERVRRCGGRAIVTPETPCGDSVYTVCGCTMQACVTLMGVLPALSESAPVFSHRPFLLLEPAMGLAFGVARCTEGPARERGGSETGRPEKEFGSNPDPAPD